jgi:MFS family permease
MTSPAQVSKRFARHAEWALWPILVSKLGNQLLVVGIPLTIYGDTRSAMLTAMAFTASTAPFVLSPLLGVVIDRYDRRTVFCASEAIQLVCITALAFLLGGGAQVPVLLLLLISSSCAVTSGLIVSYVFIPAMVPADRLGRINGLFSGGTQVIALVGMPLGGAAFGLFGSRATLLIDAITFLGTLGLVAAIPKGALGHGTAGSPWRALATGARWLRNNPAMLSLSLILGLGNLGAGALTVIVVQLAGARWHLEPSLVGLATGVGALGGALGAFFEARRKDAAAGGRRFSIGIAMTAAGAFVMWLLYASPLFLLGFLALSIGEGVINVNSVVLRQRMIPAEISGRVNATIRTIVLGAVPLSGLIQSALSQAPWAVRLFLPVACSTLAGCTWHWTSRRWASWLLHG